MGEVTPRGHAGWQRSAHAGWQGSAVDNRAAVCRGAIEHALGGVLRFARVKIPDIGTVEEPVMDVSRLRCSGNFHSFTQSGLIL